MTTVNSDLSSEHSFSISRQPIFDMKQRVWGYLLLCLGGNGPVCSASEPNDTIGANVAAGAFVGLKQVTENGKKLMVDFTDKNLLDQVPYALPPDLAAVAVAEADCLQSDILSRLSQLRQDGYTIVIRDFNADSRYEAAYALAHIFAVNTRNVPLDALANMISFARARNIQLMSTELENQRLFKHYQAIEFDYFHGPFFKSADDLKLRKMSVNEVSRFNLLKLIEAKEPDIAKVTEALQADAAISFRLLSYLNSAAFGLRQKVKSIQQAVTLLGWRKFKNWLRVILMGELNQCKYASEIIFMAAQRGKFLESIATESNYWGFDPDTLHLLGVFSLLDTLLQMPMAEIITLLPLEEKLKEALLGETNNEYYPLLQLVRALEDAKWETLQPLARQLNLDPAKIAVAFQTALEWALKWLDAQGAQLG